MKRTALAFALLGLAVLGVAVWRMEPVRSHASSAPLGARAEEPGSARDATELAQVESDPEASRVPVSADRRTASRARDAGVELSGTIVVLDERGGEHPAEDGSFRLRAPFGFDVPVAVHAGGWSAHVSGKQAVVGVELFVQDCKLGNRLAVPAVGAAEEQLDEFWTADAHRVTPCAVYLGEERIALRVRWLPDLVLDVREKSTGRPLDHVILCEGSDEPVADTRAPILGSLHPGPIAELHARDAGPSPVRIPATEFPYPRTIFARGPGLAWGHAYVGPGDAEPHVILLDPGGDVDLVVRGTARDPSTELSVARSEALRGRGFLAKDDEHASALAFRTPLDDATSFRIGGLPLGRFTAQAELRPEVPVLVGSCEFEVRADAPVTAVLELEPPPTARLVPLEGELVLPPEWELASFRLSFVRHGTGQVRDLDSASLEPEAGTRDRYRWALPPVPPGRYTAMIDCGFACAVDTGPAGRRDALVEVPPPCTVSVRCVDDESGAGARPESLTWTTTGEVTQSIARDEPNDGWEFRAPLGEVTIRNAGQSYWDARKSVTLVAGRNEVVLRLRKAR